MDNPVSQEEKILREWRPQHHHKADGKAKIEEEWAYTIAS